MPGVQIRVDAGFGDNLHPGGIDNLLHFLGSHFVSTRRVGSLATARPERGRVADFRIRTLLFLEEVFPEYRRSPLAAGARKWPQLEGPAWGAVYPQGQFCSRSTLIEKTGFRFFRACNAAPDERVFQTSARSLRYCALILLS